MNLCGICAQRWPCDAIRATEEIESLKLELLSETPRLVGIYQANLQRAEAASAQVAEIKAAIFESGSWEERCNKAEAREKDLKVEIETLTKLANHNHAMCEKAEAQILYEQERNSNNVLMYSKQVEELKAKITNLREELHTLIRTARNNSGYEPSLSVFHRQLDRAEKVLNDDTIL